MSVIGLTNRRQIKRTTFVFDFIGKASTSFSEIRRHLLEIRPGEGGAQMAKWKENLNPNCDSMRIILRLKIRNLNDKQMIGKIEKLIMQIQKGFSYWCQSQMRITDKSSSSEWQQNARAYHFDHSFFLCISKIKKTTMNPFNSCPAM